MERRQSTITAVVRGNQGLMVRQGVPLDSLQDFHQVRIMDHEILKPVILYGAYPISSHIDRDIALYWVPNNSPPSIGRIVLRRTSLVISTKPDPSFCRSR